MPVSDATRLSSPSAISYTTFRTAVLALYQPPLRARGTYLKMRNALDALATTGLTSTAELTTQTLARWLHSRAAENTNSTLSLLRSVRTACRVALEEGWLTRQPSWGRIWPRSAPPSRPRHLSHGQVAALLEHLRGCAPRDWRARRLYSLAALCAYTGLRLREATHSHVEDLDLAGRVFWVSPRRRLKTVGSAAPVPVPEELAPILTDWLPHAGPVWLFPGARRRGPWHGGGPGYRPTDRLKQAGEAVGVGGVTFHALRHTLGHLMVARFGQSADQVRSVLRHADVRTTEAHYLHRDDAESLKRIVSGVSFRAAG